ncbi:MAG: hypothetical protein IT372_25045 [Polyangiaceae bacterium]|nr:hypothetical protein [Polyangiaceae bacterium]
MSARGIACVPDALARGAVAARILGEAVGPARAAAWLLHAGGFAPGCAPCGDGARSPAPFTRDAVALWTALALVAGEDPAPWSRFGEAVGRPVGLLDGLVRLWLDPGAPDLEPAALTPLLASWLGDPGLAPRLLYALAGERSSPCRRYEIHSLLASGPFRSHLARAAASGLDDARAALGGAGCEASPLAPVAAALLDALGERFRFFDDLITFRDLLSTGGGAGMPGNNAAAAVLHDPRGAALRDAERDVGAAVDFLNETAPWSESWEVQRFGVFGSSERPVGQWFVRGTILLALSELGYGDPAAVIALLREIPDGELRYYGSWRGIPPDADDLGLMLQLAALTGEAGRRVETWIEVMRANVDEHGIVPTWFYRGPSGPTVASPPGMWAGDDCAAVRLNLLAGLLSFDPARFDDLIEANARRVLAGFAGGDVGGSYYYDQLTTALAFLRFAQLYRARAVDRTLAPSIAAAEAEIRARMAGLQRIDGGWGSPQRTAACLEGCAAAALAAPPAPDEGLLVERAARCLGEAQLADGSWPAEPLYRTPLKQGRVGYHQGRALTTALCARALGAAVGALRRAAG